PSRMDTEMFRFLEKVARRIYDIPTLPNLLTGATDLAQLRAKGVQCYGTGPAILPEEVPLGGAHTDDENITVRSLMSLIEYMGAAVIQVPANSRSPPPQTPISGRSATHPPQENTPPPPPPVSARLAFHRTSRYRQASRRTAATPSISPLRSTPRSQSTPH